MSRRRGVLGIFVLLLVSAAGRPSVAAAQDTSDRQLVQRAVAAQEGRYGCVICHKENRRDFAEGVHSAQGIVCHDCHGGDPEALEAEAAHAGDFIGRPTKLETVRICGECHSDPNRMRPFGLPADQAAEMRTSRHGELLFYHDDPNAPTCTDCHDSHTIRPPEDARSDVHPLNIMGTCIACHDDEAIMSQYGIPTGQGEVYRASAHGVGLYEKYNLAAPTCVSCHGSHSALPASATEVADVCSHCHRLVGQAFYDGPHGPAARAGKMPGCLGCHSNHDTELVPIHGIEAVCRGCHQEAGSDAVQMGAEIQILAERASQNVRFAEEAIDELQAAGRETDDARFRFRSALTDYHLMGPAQHSLDLETLEDLGRKVSSVSANIRNRAEVMEEQRWEHTLLLVPTWFLALAAVFLATVLVRQGRRDG
ncbi:MAG: cytochrome c3 family protein [Gemmatimonadales bacterium]